MKQYFETALGFFMYEGAEIPSDPANGHYRTMLDEIEAGEAAIVPYSPPAPSIQQQTDALEASVTPRNLRGAALSDQYAIDRLQSIEDQITALRDQL